MNNHLDNEGYLLSPQVWSVDLALEFAQTEQLELSELHWQIINFTRDFYLQNNAMPKMREVIAFIKQSSPDATFNSAKLHLLFPFGPALQIAKIAGLPKPTKCL